MADELDAWMTAARDRDDRAAFALVVQATHRLLRLTLLRDTADAELADELAQETLTRAWAKREHYRPGTSPKAWLLAIARSQLLEHHRHADRNRRHLKHLIRLELLRHRDEEDNLHSERLEALHGCLESISLSQRQVLDLVHRDGLSTEDAAREMGIAHAACRQRLSRLQRALRSCVDERLRREG